MLKKINYILFYIFGFIMIYSFVALLVDDGKEFVEVTMSYLWIIEGTIREAATFIGGCIGFFTQLLIINIKYHKDK